MMNSDSSSTVQENTELHEFAFTGNAKEYFGIWIVNLLLSIITIGIYTAWAKVRRQRYFYGNTWMDGHNFEYHARPKQILIGRVIVVGYLIIVNILSQVNPIFGTVLTLPYLLLLPWVINKAIAFNARMTSYRNVRFSFSGTYWRALGIFILLPLAVFLPFVAVGVVAVLFQGDNNEAASAAIGGLALLALLVSVLLIPFVSRAGVNYIGNNTSFGNAKFETNAPLTPIYKNLGATFLFSLAALFGVGVFMFGLIFALLGADFDPDNLQNPAENLGLVAAFFLIGILAYTPLIMAYAFYSAGMRNIAFRYTFLDGKHRLNSRLSRTRYLWIMISNAIVTILSFALMRPWAAIRTWRYLAANTYFVSVGSLDNFIDVQEDQGNVAAAEYLDIDGIDFGL